MRDDQILNYLDVNRSSLTNKILRDENKIKNIQKLKSVVNNYAV